MLRAIFHGVMRVSRTAVLTASVALSLALVFGLATTALGATGGTFVPGKSNLAAR